MVEAVVHHGVAWLRLAGGGWVRQWAPHAYDSPQHGDAVFFQYGWHRKDEVRERRTGRCTSA